MRTQINYDNLALKPLIANIENMFTEFRQRGK